MLLTKYASMIHVGNSKNLQIIKLQGCKSLECHVQRGLSPPRVVTGRRTWPIKSYPRRYRDGRRWHGRSNNEAKPGNHKNDQE